MIRCSIHKLFFVVVSVMMLSCMSAVAQDVPELQINSKRYIVLDADNGAIYVQKNADEQVAIASLTKVFTAVQALQMASLDTEIITHESDMVDPANNTYMGFGIGESYTLRDMLYGMMLPSGNDAAHAIARSLGYQDGDSPQESVDRFMSWVNQRNADMGLTNTHLLNPDGWGVEGHYSTARDVATFMRYAMTFPDLVTIMGTSSYTTQNGWITITNTNKLLNQTDLVDGGKTGYDWDSGYCLIEFASRNNSTMISVTLDGIAPDDWYDDNRVLLDYAFETKAGMTAAEETFAGEIASFADPAAAEIARAASIGGSFASGEWPEDEPQNTQVMQPVEMPEHKPAVPENESIADTIAENGRWIAIGTAAALLLFPALRTFRTSSRDVDIHSAQS